MTGEVKLINYSHYPVKITIYINLCIQLQIDNKTLQWLDRNLFVGEEVKSVYEEVMKSIDKDHLVFDQVMHCVLLYH